MEIVHMYLLVFLLMVMIKKVEPGRVIQEELCCGEDLKMETNHTAIEIYVYFNGMEIANTRNVPSMKWDKSPAKIYRGRLFFNNARYISITLKNVSVNDTGLFRIVTKSLEGKQRYPEWNVTVLVAPNFEEQISISVDSVNASCYRLQCGTFLSLGKPEVHFNWSVSNSKEQTVTVCGLRDCLCHVVGPATTCLAKNLSAEFCISNAKHRRRRSVDDKQCVWAHTEKHDPMNPVPIVLGVLVPITAIAVITVIIVFYKRCSRKRGVQGPPGNYEPVSMGDNKDV